MLRVFRQGASGFESPACTAEQPVPNDAVWLDLINPTRDEELAVEERLGILLPTREEMTAIEPSTRLYQENGATFITAFVLINAETERPDTAPVTFVLTADKLITIRYGEFRAFRLFGEKAERQPDLCATSAVTFLNLLDGVVDRTADVLEKVSDHVDGISQTVFQQTRTHDFESCLYRLGKAQTTNAEIRHSLASLARATSFATLAPVIATDREHRDHLRTVTRDAESLSQQSDAISGNIGFLLNAALGLINIEQSNVIKIFSIAAVVFLPPTLVASIYGMNFDFMPELHWRLGYPFALGVMVLSVAATLWWFKQRRWL